MPLRTRCRASAHARSGRPTMTKDGAPFLTSASTSTRRGSRPTSACVTARASTSRRYVEMCDETVRASSRHTHTRPPGGARLRVSDQHVLVVLAGPTPRPPIHVPPEPRLELEPGTLEDRRIEIAAVVHDDQQGRARLE